MMTGDIVSIKAKAERNKRNYWANCGSWHHQVFSLHEL
jgi:hypothetical protein